MSATNIYIIGHRGTGKSTTARLAGAQLGLEVVDLDEVLEAGEHMTCAEIIADSEPRFRDLERAYLAELVATPSDEPRIISLGGGFSPVPTDGVCVWLYRDGWRETAADAREQLRPETDLADEFAWMVAEREPMWERGAHLRLDIARGRGPERAAAELATQIQWLLELADSPWAQRTWMVPADASQLARAVRDARLLGLAGVEVRSDLVSVAEDVDFPVDVLASLRTPEPRWLLALDEAAAIDIDLAFVDDVLAAGVLDELAPRTLLVSWHPSEEASGSVGRLAIAADKLAEAHPAWADHLALKYAPTLAGYADLFDALDAASRLREAGRPVTFLPQGARFAWCRPPLLRQNATNYVPVGLAPHRRRHTQNPVQTPLDLQAWLPHLAGPAPQVFEALLGDPVATSQGDVWHRRAARSEGQRASYVKIPFGRDQSAFELDMLLACLQWLDVRGLSVTSPMKRAVLDAGGVDNPEGLSAANTLRFVDGRWEATDTDQAGMAATLRAAEEQGIAPGTVAIIGRGGVSPAVLRAVDESAWELVHHASGRAGWTDEAPGEVTMVINAAGDSDTAYEHPPACKVWVDLHYAGVRQPPEGVLHMNGDIFFDAQAHAQRQFWYAGTEEITTEDTESTEEKTF